MKLALFQELLNLNLAFEEVSEAWNEWSGSACFRMT